MATLADYPVAQTILQQIGGGQFITMTGSKIASVADDSITFRLTRNSASATFLKITYLPGPDSYTMEFTRVRKYELLPVETIEDVYFDQLQDIFERVTGLYTTLFGRR